MNTPTRGETAPPEQAPLLTVEAQPMAPRVLPRGASPTKVFWAWSPAKAALLPAAKRDHLGEGYLGVFLLDLPPTLTLQPCSRPWTPMPTIGASPRMIRA